MVHGNSLYSAERPYGSPHGYEDWEDGAFFSDNFRLLRMLAALCVAATHSLWVVYGFNPPTDGMIGALVQISHCGICIFFGLSGYLITASLMERPHFLHFIVSRVMRLCPLLIFAGILMAFVAGPFVTSVSFGEYYGNWRLWAFVPLSAMTIPDMTLPGVFETAPAAGEVNVSIWTLRYEVIGYIGLGVVAALGLLKERSLWILALLYFVGFCYISYMTELRAEVPFLQHGLRFGFALMVGVLLYSYAPHIPMNIGGVIVLTGLAVYTNSGPYMEPFRIVALVYGAIWFGSKEAGFLDFYNRLGDYSYGVFLFHWPIAQMVLQYNPGISYFELLSYVMPLSLGLAVISWHGIEAPALASRGAIVAKCQHWFDLLLHAGKPGLEWGKQGMEIMTTFHEKHQLSQGKFGFGQELHDGHQHFSINQLRREGRLYPDQNLQAGADRQQTVTENGNQNMNAGTKAHATFAERQKRPADPNVPASLRPFATGYQRR